MERFSERKPKSVRIDRPGMSPQNRGAIVGPSASGSESVERFADIWQVALDQPADVARDCESILCLSETVRANRYATLQLRSRFIVGRASLRSILGHYLTEAAQHISISESRYGKPFLPDHSLWFNVSHSHDRMLCAVTPCGPIGIDIERISAARDLQGIAQRYFAAGEYRRFEGLRDCDRLRGFYECWTRKEAFIKATGAGLSQDLKSFEVAFGPGESPQLLVLQHACDLAADWGLTDIDVGGDFCGAVVYRAPEPKINMRRFEPADELKRLRKGSRMTSREAIRDLHHC
jgi:4'-phosphopantetheinyl transferase